MRLQIILKKIVEKKKKQMNVSYHLRYEPSILHIKEQEILSLPLPTVLNQLITKYVGEYKIEKIEI